MISALLGGVLVTLAVAATVLNCIDDKLKKQNRLLERIAVTLEAQEKLKRDALASQ